VEERSARACSGREERGRRGGGGEGLPGRPFIGPEGERGGQTGKGIRRPVVGHHYWPSSSVGRGNEVVSGGEEGGVRHCF
jgi:hypothetical protein